MRSLWMVVSTLVSLMVHLATRQRARWGPGWHRREAMGSKPLGRWYGPQGQLWRLEKQPDPALLKVTPSGFWGLWGWGCKRLRDRTQSPRCGTERKGEAWEPRLEVAGDWGEVSGASF